MVDSNVVAWLAQKYADIAGDLDEKGKRRWAAIEARALGWGGITAVAKATGISDKTIRTGIKELKSSGYDDFSRVRKEGGGRKPQETRRPDIVKALDSLIEPSTRGDPVSPLRWTCKSTRSLSMALKDQGFEASPNTIRRLLKKSGYSLQANRKTREGKNHPDRNKQFEFIAKRVGARRRRGEPAISVDTKKKEIIGRKRNTGRSYRKKKSPIEVDVHDFPDKDLGKAIPYGVYDIFENRAGVSVGISNDTAEFAVAAIKRWWKKLGEKRYSSAKRILITADCGGSNSARSRLWKIELQKFANFLEKKIEVCHYPPGTSKWNKIEHRLFCHITRNWAGVPLETLEIIVSLIGGTKTSKGLEVHAWIDRKAYRKGKKVSKNELNECNIQRDEFHGEWNYVISPQEKIR